MVESKNTHLISNKDIQINPSTHTRKQARTKTGSAKTEPTANTLPTHDTKYVTIPPYFRQKCHNPFFWGGKNLIIIKKSLLFQYLFHIQSRNKAL